MLALVHCIQLLLEGIHLVLSLLLVGVRSVEAVALCRLDRVAITELVEVVLDLLSEVLGLLLEALHILVVGVLSRELVKLLDACL